MEELTAIIYKKVPKVILARHVSVPLNLVKTPHPIVRMSKLAEAYGESIEARMADDENVPDKLSGKWLISIKRHGVETCYMFADYIQYGGY